MLLRPQAVVLCSSGPCEVSEKFPFSLRAMQGERKVNIMQITGKKGGEVALGQGEKIMDDCGGFIVFLNYRFSETEILIDHQLVNPSTKKTSQSQRSPIFMAAFCSTW